MLVGHHTDRAALEALAGGCDVVTFDHELVPHEHLVALEAAGHALRPSAATMALAQDKQKQREQHAALGLPVPAFRVTHGPNDAIAFAADHGWPVVAKTARGGYDGRGVWILRDAAGVADFAADIAGRDVPIVLERHVRIDRELAVMVARRPNGEQAVYPVVETVQVDGICREIVADAGADPALAARAEAIAHTVAEAAGVTGVLAVELFESAGELLINEIATRPHNSGHWTIEGAVTSQFEQHLRAVLDWPLGSVALTSQVVVTVNVLGPADGSDPAARIADALAVPGAHVHLYGKVARPGRKLGHVTALGSDLSDTRARARRAVELLTGEPQEWETGR